MTRHLDVDRVIEDWFADLPSSLPDRVVDRLVDDLDRTPQRRRFWLLPRRDQMNRFVMTAGAVAAIALVAVIGIGLVSGGGGLFGAGPTPSPSPSPTPSPTLIARGVFPLMGGNAELEATGSGDNVSGTLNMAHDTGDFSVDLKCTTTTDDGVILIVGDITESESQFAPKGNREVIILKPGSAVRGGLDAEEREGGSLTRSTSCQGLLEQVVNRFDELYGDIDAWEPIEGSVEFGP
jgi:hypothetical protein